MLITHYKSFDGTKMPIDIYYPPNWKREDKRGMMILLHGGGWTNGSSKKFTNQGAELSRLGVVVAVPTYRTYSVAKTTVDVAVQNAIYSVNHLFECAEEFGVDPEKIVLGGGSAGGHLCLSTLLLDGFRPNDFGYVAHIKGCVLFCPVLDTVTQCQYEALLMSPIPTKELSPYHNLRKNMPDVLILHGSHDEVIPLQSVEEFQKALQTLGNQCEVVVYDGRKHGFFNMFKDSQRILDYYSVLGHVVNFLFQRGLITL